MTAEKGVGVRHTESPVMGVVARLSAAGCQDCLGMVWEGEF